MKNISIKNALGIAVISCLGILFQVSLSRLLAVTIWYHFAFLVISLAMLGLVASAIICFLYWDKILGKDYRHQVSVFCVLFSVLAPLAFFMHLNLNFISIPLFSLKFFLILGVQLVFFIAVFFAMGMGINIILFKEQNQIGRMYCFDLLGAAAGSGLAMVLMYYFSPMAIVFLMSFVGLLVAWLFQSSVKGRGAVAALLALSLFAFFKHDSWEALRIRAVKSYTKEFLQKKGERPVFEAWSPFGRTSVNVVHSKDPLKLAGIRIENDAGAPAPLIPFHAIYWNQAYFQEFILRTQDSVHFLKNDEDVLIIGSGGGRNVLSALVFKAKHITAVELNPVTARIVTQYFKDYIGDIFHYPQVHFVNQEGRSYVAGDKNKYGIIQISGIDTWGGQNSAYIFNENNLYTMEAVDDYMAHLKADGILSISRIHAYDETLRIANMVLHYLEEKQMQDILTKLIVFRSTETRYPPQLGTVLLKASGFDQAEVRKIAAFLNPSKGKMIYAPYLSASQMDQSAPAVFIRRLIHAADNKNLSRKELADSYPRNISSPTDDKPFFFFMTKIKDTFNFSIHDHPARKYALPLLYSICLLMVLLSMVMIGAPLLHQEKYPVKADLLYFAAIGLGFLLIELSLIQRLTVFLGHQIYAFVTVLSALLLSGGMGSLISSRINAGKERRYLAIILLMILGWGSCVGFFFYDQMVHLMGLAKIERIFLSVFIIAPLGVLMGMCLPLGIRILQQWDQRLIVWAWGINGIFSILASVLSIVLALNFGLKSVFLIGVACYLAAWWIARKWPTDSALDRP